MCCMCSIAQRNWYHERLEAFLNQSDQAQRNANRLALLQALQNPANTYTQAMFAVGVLDASNPKHKQLATHLDIHWFGAKSNLQSAWWPDHEHAENIIIQATIEFLENQECANLPIHILWVCSGEYFQCVMTRSAVQLTFITVTPPIPGGHTLPASVHKQDIEIVASDEEAEYCERAAVRQGGTQPIRKKSVGRSGDVSVMDCYSEDRLGV